MPTDLATGLMDELWYVLVIAACLLASAFFSGSETALLRLRQHEIEKDVQDARGPAAVAVRDLLRSTSRLLITILLVNVHFDWVEDDAFRPVSM